MACFRNGDAISRRLLASSVSSMECMNRMKDDRLMLIFPDDLYVSPNVRVEFAGMPDHGSTMSYSDENTIVMRLVPARSVASPPAIRVMCLLPGREDRESLDRYDDRSTWMEVQTWSSLEYILVLGRVYHVVDGRDAFIFDVRPPALKDLAVVCRRGIDSYALSLHRMMLGGE